MRRRQLLHTSLMFAGASLLAACRSERQTPQASVHAHRIGWLGPGQANFWQTSPQMEAFRLGLRQQGYEDGQNLHIEFRFAEDQLERLPALAAELVQANVALIVAQGAGVLQALRQATSTLPIVMVVYNGDPVRDGVITSFARPGGNITGLTLIGPRLAGKRLELLQATVPALTRVAVLWLPATASRAQLLALQEAAPAAGLEVLSVPVPDMSALPAILTSALADQPEALIVTDDSIWLPHIETIGAFAIQHRLPAMSNARPSAQNGMMLKYGPDAVDLFRRSASYVDKILRGTPPGELPMEEPTRFDLLISQATAQRLGLTIPPAVLAQATEVIQ